MTDEFSDHEALDRLSLVCSIISEHLLDHPSIVENKTVKSLVDSAMRDIAMAYQKMGEIRFEKQKPA